MKTSRAENGNKRLTRNGSHPDRRAFTLLELMLVLVLTTSLLAGTIALIAVVQRSSERAKNNLLLRQEIRRFADEFRRDFTAFSDYEINDNEIRLTGNASDQSVTYQIQSESSVARVLQQPDASAPANEQYVFGNQASIEIDHLDKIDSVQWTITQSDRPEEPIRILASAGKK